MLRILSAFAALLLVAACSTDPESSKTSKGDSQTTGQSSSSSVNTSSIAPGSMEDFVVNVGDRVFFALDSSELSSTAQDTLAKQAAWLKAYPAVNITVEGHCDERGTREYNLALGERRANAAKNYLVSQGISAGRIATISYGKEKPVALGSNEEAWAQNRRGVSVPANVPGS
jgi:peptidoglycan-associated lipoprotein